MASSLGVRTLPAYRPGHGDSTTPFTPWSRPRRYPGHVPARPGPAQATCRPSPPAPARLLAPPGSRHGPGLAAARPHRNWSSSPSGSLVGPATVRALLGSGRLGSQSRPSHVPSDADIGRSRCRATRPGRAGHIIADSTHRRCIPLLALASRVHMSQCPGEDPKQVSSSSKTTRRTT
jgi:hypothetical protein